ncbi:unnamed protein product [Caenorhabditis auriculariae]|uniref:Uncharacterized protein n=1 Tax=Caenorhabditis auriculariae TaxID=2777116 RepID=A0A8S1HCR8_9PELO|nr:unnamed protein product [Caenorhabditis auriculariae]
MADSSEDQETQATPVRSAMTSKRHLERGPVGGGPFETCLLVILTVASLLQIAALLVGTSLHTVGSVLSLLIAVFMYEWFNVHFMSMTRTRRACFDVANVLETYQPRARTHGHLFIPDPPTPCVTIAEGTENHEQSKERTAFTNARDSHYENMYQKAMQMNKEMEAASKAAGSETLDSGAEDFKLTPADPEKDKKEYDSKKKKEVEKYKAESSKHLSC